MSHPNDGSWNEGDRGQWGQQSSPEGNRGGNQGQSLGQNFSAAEAQQNNSGPQQQPQWNDNQGYGQQYDHQQQYDNNQQYGAQPQYDGNQQFGGQPQYDGNQQFGGQPVAGGQQLGGGGVGEVFGDSKFAKALTEKIAGPTFLLVTAATVLWALFDIIYGFMGDKWSGGSDVTVKMSVFPAILNLLADLAIAGAIILGTRVLLELAINVARIATRGRD